MFIGLSLGLPHCILTSSSSDQVLTWAKMAAENPQQTQFHHLAATLFSPASSGPSTGWHGVLLPKIPGSPGNFSMRSDEEDDDCYRHRHHQHHHHHHHHHHHEYYYYYYYYYYEEEEEAENENNCRRHGHRHRHRVLLLLLLHNTNNKNNNTHYDDDDDVDDEDDDGGGGDDKGDDDNEDDDGAPHKRDKTAMTREVDWIANFMPKTEPVGSTIFSIHYHPLASTDTCLWAAGDTSMPNSRCTPRSAERTFLPIFAG